MSSNAPKYLHMFNYFLIALLMSYLSLKGTFRNIFDCRSFSIWNSDDSYSNTEKYLIKGYEIVSINHIGRLYSVCTPASDTLK